MLNFGDQRTNFQWKKKVKSLKQEEAVCKEQLTQN